MNKLRATTTIIAACITFCSMTLLLVPKQALAIPAITCHCFTDRSFTAERPAAADPYFLATTQNSFFALMFPVDKKTVVIKKQSGTSSDDLWVAYWLARNSTISPDTLLQARSKKNSWKEVAETFRIPLHTLGTHVSAGLEAAVPTASLAEAILDELCIRNQLLSSKELLELRKAGASNQEVIIAAVISLKSGQPAVTLYKEVKNGVKTWGFLLKTLAFDTKNMQSEIQTVLKRPVK